MEYRRAYQVEAYAGSVDGPSVGIEKPSVGLDEPASRTRGGWAARHYVTLRLRDWFKHPPDLGAPCVQVSLGAYGDLENFRDELRRVPVDHRVIKRSLTGQGACIGVGAMLEKHCNDRGPTKERRGVQGRRAVGVRCVHISAAVDQQLRRIGIAEHRGPRQRSRPD